MTLRTTAIRPRRAPRSVERLWHRPDNVIIALTLIVTAAAATTMHLPPKSPPLTVVNDSNLTVSLEVRPANAPGWMGLGAFPPGRTVIHEVIDQGATWLVRARVGSHIAAPFAVPREQLDAHHWRLAVPQSVAASLQHRGAVPEP
jgi:hypothetical protein